MSSTQKTVLEAEPEREAIAMAATERLRAESGRDAQPGTARTRPAVLVSGGLFGEDAGEVLGRIAIQFVWPREVVIAETLGDGAEVA